MLTGMARQIEAKMIQFLDKKLALNGAAQEAIKNKDARSLMIYAAEACVGIREEGGNNRGPMVSLIQDTVDGPDHVAWCMSFVQTCIAYAEVKTGVKSPVAVSEHCLTTWVNTPKSQRVKVYPARGAIIIWQHGTSQAGHTGFFLEGTTTKMSTVEGNTGDANMREGDGIYKRERSLKANGSMRVVGFLKPF